MTNVGQGKFLQVQFRGFLQIGYSLFDGGALADGTYFWALGDVEAAFSVQDGGQCVYRHMAVF